MTDCSGTGGSQVTTTSSWTQINLPASDVVLKCALAQLSGTSGVRILAHSIKVDGPGGGSVNSSGSAGTQLVAGSASGQCNAGATVDVETAAVRANNPNGDLKITGCGDIVLNSSTLSSSDANVTVTSSDGRICISNDSVSGSAVTLTASADLTMRGATVTVAVPSDNIKLVSNNGSVLAGGAACPNKFTGGIDSNMTITAKQLIDLTSACIDMGHNVNFTASGSGFACATDVIINLSGSEIRNDIGQVRRDHGDSLRRKRKDQHQQRHPRGQRCQRRRAGSRQGVKAERLARHSGRQLRCFDGSNLHDPSTGQCEQPCQRQPRRPRLPQRNRRPEVRHVVSAFQSDSSRGGPQGPPHFLSAVVPWCRRGGACPSRLSPTATTLRPRQLAFRGRSIDRVPRAVAPPHPDPLPPQAGGDGISSCYPLSRRERGGVRGALKIPGRSARRLARS